MIITQFIFLFFILSFIVNKKRAILYILPLSLFFTTLPLVKIGGTYIGLCDAINFVICGYVFSKKRARNSIFYNPLFYPLFANFIFLLLIAAYGTERTSLYVLWKTISNEILLPLALIYFLQTKTDIELLVKLYLKVFMVLCIYGIIEFLLNHNIILYWLQSQTDLSFWVDHTNDIRYGYGRYNSFFHFPITFGDACVVFFYFLIFFYNKYRGVFILRKSYINTLCLLLIGVFLANSRATILALVFGLLQFDYIRKPKTLLIAFFIFLIMVLPFSNYILNVYHSIFDFTGNYDVGGSSMEMRMRQLNISLFLFLQNPIFGGGLSMIYYLMTDISIPELAGAESQLFYLLIERGLLGILGYLWLIISMCKLLPSYRKFNMVFVGIWVLASFVSLTVGLYINFPIIFLLIIYKSQKLNLLIR